MSIICNVDFSTAQKYRGKSLSAKYSNKKHRVYLKLVCDDSTLQECIELAKQSKNILMISYQGLGSWEHFKASVSGVYVGYGMDFGVDISEEDIERALVDIPDGITPIIHLPESFKDMEFLWRVSKKFPRLRFSGGQLFSIAGVKVGEIGVDVLERHDVKFGAESYRLRFGVDAVENVAISSLEIDASGKPESTSTRKPKSTTSAKKTDNIRGRIGQLFMDSEFRGL